MTDPLRRALVGSGLLGIAMPMAAQQARRLAPIALKASDGLPVLGDAPGVRATYIDFWASWCTPCKLSFPWMSQMHEQLGAHGLRIVAINIDRKEADAQKFLTAFPTRFAIAMDPAAETAQLLAIRAMPTSLIVAADRTVRLVHTGFRLDDRDELQARLRDALA